MPTRVVAIVKKTLRNVACCNLRLFYCDLFKKRSYNYTRDLGVINTQATIDMKSVCRIPGHLDLKSSRFLTPFKTIAQRDIWDEYFSAGLLLLGGHPLH